MGKRGQRLFSTAVGTVLAAGLAVRQRGLLLCSHWRCAAASESAGLLLRPQGEPLSAPDGGWVGIGGRRHTFFCQIGIIL